MDSLTPPQRFLFKVFQLTATLSQRVVKYYETPTAYDSHREDMTTDEQWKIYLCNFLWLGLPFKWSANKMIAAGILSRPEWDVYTDTAQDSSILLKINEPGRKKTVWHPHVLGLTDGMNTYRHARQLIKLGIIPIVHATHPKTTPPTLLISRSTAAQATQHRRGVALPYTAYIAAQKSGAAGGESDKITVLPASTQTPQWVEVGMPEWLRFESDRIERVLASHRFPVRVENAVAREGIKVFSLHLHTMGSQRVEKFMEMNDKIALALGAEYVSIQVYPAQRCAVISCIAN